MINQFFLLVKLLSLAGVKAFLNVIWFAPTLYITSVNLLKTNQVAPRELEV